MGSILDVPRVSRSAVWNRAEELTRLNPNLDAADALYQAMKYYEVATPDPMEMRLVEALIERPESLFRRRGR